MFNRILLGNATEKYESELGFFSNVGNNIVVADLDNDNRLLCIYLPKKKLVDMYLRQEALKLLSEYMVPSVWIRVENYYIR